MFRVRRQAILEVFIVYALVVAALWTYGHVQVFWIAMGVTCVIVMSVRGARSSRELGLGRPPRQGSARIIAFGLLAAFAILGIGAVAGTLHLPHGRHSPVLGFVIYLAFAFAQEFVLQSFFLVRLETLFSTSSMPSPRRTVWAAAALFCLAHIPNPVLVPATFLGALLFCETFRRFRNIYPIALIHLALGLAVAAAVPEALTHQMKIGLAYLTYH